MQKCKSALSAGMAGMGKKDGKVSTNRICKRTKVQFLHFCTFPFLAVMADTTRLAGPSRICKSAKLQFCIFALSAGRAGTAGNAKL